jgi:hypothetical protein
MRLEVAIVLPFLVAGTVAKPYKIEGSASTFKAENLTDSKQWTGKIYDNCRQFHGNTIVSKGRPCVSELLKTTLTALTVMRHVEEPVKLVNNEIGLEDELKPEMDSHGAKSKRGDDVDREMLLGRINSHNSKQSNNAHLVRAVQIGHSMVHPRDGISVRTNVHNDDTTLHVHTNGSHATAMFEKTTLSQMHRRDEASLQFEFGGMKGIKAQIDWAVDEQKRYWSSSDLNYFTTAFGHGDGVMDPPFGGSNTWKFVACNTTDNTIDNVKLFQGKFISLVDPTDYSYEKEDDMDCN